MSSPNLPTTAPRGYSKSSVAVQVDALPKKIIICCDGTWQSATSLDPMKGVSSNVARLSRVLANAGKERKKDPSDPDKVWQQVVYYDAGIGTGDVGPLEPLRQGSLGSGLNENIVEAYNFIVNNYAPGDKLYFFGFSRGAFTVRAVAGLLCHIGVLKPSFMSAFLKAYAAYLHPTKAYPKEHKPFSTCKPWAEFLQANSGVKYANCLPEKVDIEVIGVWDTVGSLGVPDLGHLWRYHKADPSVYECYDTDLHPQIRHAYQALALDEKRGPFSPSVWKLKGRPAVQKPDGTWGKPDVQIGQFEPPPTNLVQCWFPGAHVNVGGGSSSNTGPNPSGDREQLASIAYAWMLDRIRPFLALSEDALQAQLDEFKALAEGRAVKSDMALKSIAGQGDSETAKLLSHLRTDVADEKGVAEKKGWSIWDAPAYLKSFLVKSSTAVMPVGYALGSVDESYTTMYQFMGSPEIRTPGQYHDYKASEFTTERIHPSVHYRREFERSQGKKEDELYQPTCMPGWKRVYEEAGFGRDFTKRKGFKWILKGEKGEPDRFLWEFEIGDMPEKTSIEKRLIEVSWVKEVHEKVKQEWLTL
ncbi:hypothetical protein BDZ45DRAFT_154222 [Acephala macrosclerotiorum]|nr:hypothetical protein BDZ45DRAFT_154222 [Acephala macrosclerotiorum]